MAQAAALAEEGEVCEVERAFLNGKEKMVTVYYGELGTDGTEYGEEEEDGDGL